MFIFLAASFYVGVSALAFLSLDLCAYTIQSCMNSLHVVALSDAVNCTLPAPPEDDVSLASTFPEDGVYDVGDVIVWDCDDGFGHLWQTCESNSQFSDPNKDCGGEIPYPRFNRTSY